MPDDYLEKIQAACRQTLAESLGIAITHASAEEVRATMPVDKRTVQPAGLLHGGASVALAETLASIGGLLNVVDKGSVVVGQEINANHLRPVKEGAVHAVAKPVHRGQSSQVWEIHIHDGRDRLVCISRCTLRNIRGRNIREEAVVESKEEK